MINVSKEFKEKIEYGRFLLYLTITLADGKVLNLDDSNIWEGGFKIDEGVTESGEFTIGSCIINKMTVVLHDEEEKLSRQVFDGAQVIPYVGIELDNGSIEKIPKGVYEVDSTSYDGDLITLECLDNMHKLDKEYAGVTTTYPATIQTIVNDLCRYCGVVLQAARFDGYNVKLTKRPTNSGITCRQVLSYAMQMICKFAKCDSNGKLIIDWFNQRVFEQNALLDGGIFDDDSPYSSGDDADGGTFSPWNTGYEHSSGTFEDMNAFHHIYTLDTLDVAVEDVIISGVQVTAETEDTENGDTFFYGEEGYVLKISGNPFITKENAANFAEYLGKKLIGLIFRPLDASALPDPTVEAGDIAYISDGPSKSYSALVTNLSFDPDDNMSISCDAESPKKTESQRPTELEQTLAKMRKETENTLSAYDLVVQQMSQLAANTLGFHETKIIQDDGSVIVYRHDKPKLSESKIVYKSGIDGFFVTKNYTGKDSTTVWKAGFDSNGNAALNILSVIGIHWDWAYGGILSLGGKGNGNGVLRIYDKHGKVKAVLNYNGLVIYRTPLNPDSTTSQKYSGLLFDGACIKPVEGTTNLEDEDEIIIIDNRGVYFDRYDENNELIFESEFQRLYAGLCDCYEFHCEGGTATLDEATITGNASVDGKATVAGNASVSGDATVTGDVSIGGALKSHDINADGLIYADRFRMNKELVSGSGGNNVGVKVYSSSDGPDGWGEAKYWYFYKVSSSSKRYKDVGDIISEKDIENWYNIRPLWAKYKAGYLMEDDENEGKYLPMFIAEDVEKYFPQAVIHEGSQVEDWNYRIMIPAMFAMIKQQKEEIESLKQAVKGMRGN